MFLHKMVASPHQYSQQNQAESSEKPVHPFLTQQIYASVQMLRHCLPFVFVFKMACHKSGDEQGPEVAEYTAAPIFMDRDGKCRHQWVVEFRKKPESVSAFAEILDQALQKINSDYEAKRSKNITLQPLEMVEAREGLFDDWLRGKGKLGGQHKIPRLCNDRKIIEEILSLQQ